MTSGRSGGHATLWLIDEVKAGGLRPALLLCTPARSRAITVTTPSASGTFDCFECAIHALAPTCAHCGCKIIGHGAEHDGTFYCCAHCARRAGVKGIDDRA